MNTIQQISILVENQTGKLAEAAQLIGDAGVDLRSLSLADTREFGILRVIVSDTDKACSILRENGWTCKVTPVIGVKVPDQPNGLTQVLTALQAGNINVEYMYAFVSGKGKQANVILSVDDNDNCLTILAQQGIEILTAEEAYCD